MREVEREGALLLAMVEISIISGSESESDSSSILAWFAIVRFVGLNVV